MIFTLLFADAISGPLGGLAVQDVSAGDEYQGQLNGVMLARSTMPRPFILHRLLDMGSPLGNNGPWELV